MKPAPFDYKRAASVAGALDAFAAASGSAKYVAGSQTLGPMINLRLTQVDTLIDLSRIHELRQSEDRTGFVRFGAGIRHCEIEDGRVPDPSLGLMQRAASGLAYRAVRNRGTIGGSLAHGDPVAEWPNILAALSAVVNTLGASGEKNTPVRDFLRGHLTTSLEDEEIVTSIDIPKLPPRTRLGYQKFCRKVGEFAHSMAVVVIPPGGAAQVVLGCAAGTPIHLASTASFVERAAAKAGSFEAELRATLKADFNQLKLHLDAYEENLHATMVVRSVEEALRS